MKKNAPTYFFYFTISFLFLFHSCGRGPTDRGGTHANDGPFKTLPARLNHANIKLKIPSGLYYQRTPDEDLSVAFSTVSIINSLNIFTTDNSRVKVFKNSGDTVTLGKNDPGYLLAIPALYDISKAGDTAIFSFGVGGAADNSAAAVVKVIFGDFPETKQKNYLRQMEVEIQVADTQILNYDRTGTMQGPTSPKQYLTIIGGNQQNKASIYLDESLARGKVMICIINRRNHQLIALLNPKSSNQMPFVTRHEVYIIPIIAPNLSGNYGLPIDSINFSVGDPKVNGSVTASEE